MAAKSEAKVTGAKVIGAIVVFVLLLWSADAYYPNWSWQCTGSGSPAGHGPNDPVSRAQTLKLPPGCKARADNMLRNIWDYWTVPDNQRLSSSEMEKFGR